MKRPTFRDIGIRWWYWICAAGFGLVCAGSVYGSRIEPENERSILLCGAFFGVISLLAFLWPVFRIRERQGIEQFITPTRRVPCRGVLIPISRVKIVIGLLGGSICGIGALLCALFADEPKNRIEGALAFAGYLGLLITFLWQASKRRPGILLTSQGIVWSDYLYSTRLVRWDEITACKTYLHQGEYNKSPSLGVQFYHLERLELSAGTKRKLTNNFRRWGWHCYFHAESLLVPISDVEQMINFYRHNADARSEFVNGSIRSRFASVVE